MRCKRSSTLKFMAIVASTLVLQFILLTILFHYTAPSKNHQRVWDQRLSKRLPKDYSLPLLAGDVSLVNVRSVKQSQDSEERSVKELHGDIFEENMVQRKRPKEGIEELERAPKQFINRIDADIVADHQDSDNAPQTEKHNSHVPNEKIKQNVQMTTNKGNEAPGNLNEFTGLKQAIVRNNDDDTNMAIALTTQDFQVPNLPSKKSVELSETENEELLQDWEKHQLRIIRSSKKLKNLLARSNPMESYSNFLKLPKMREGISINDYVANIQSLGKTNDLTGFLKDTCEGTREELLECSGKEMRELTPHEQQGRNIMFTLRTTKIYHETRLPILFETWITTLYPESLFLVTDDDDSELAEQLEEVGMHYINAKSGHTHGRIDLCCKAGVELELMSQPENDHFDWVCHVDDDMYIHVQPLAQQLSKFAPRTDPVYLGRSGSEWDSPRVVNITSKLGKSGQKYHFAVGGMYCLSRAMLELAKPYLVGCHAFSESCNKTQEPEDVTVGLVIGAVLKKPLTHTQMIWTHGLDLLTSVPSPYIRDQIAFSHGFGSQAPWMPVPNVAFVPGAIFSIDEDITQFKSIHCNIYPTLDWCIEQKRAVLEEKRRLKEEGDKGACMCAWETYICCELIRTGYFTVVAAEAKARARQENESAKSKEMEVVQGNEPVKGGLGGKKVKQSAHTHARHKLQPAMKRAIDSG